MSFTLHDLCYLICALVKAAADSIRTFNVVPHLQNGKRWSRRDKIKRKYSSALNIFRESLSIRLAHSIIVTHWGMEGLLANFLHVLEVLHRSRPGAAVYVNWRLTSSETGFRYGRIGEDVWCSLFLPIMVSNDSERYIADTPVDYAFWGSGKDYLKGRWLKRHRSAYARTLCKWITVTNQRVREEVDFVYQRAFKSTVCIGVHRRVGNSGVARCQYNGINPSIETIIEYVWLQLKAANTDNWLVFLATDDSAAIPVCKREFGDRLLVREHVQRTTYRDIEVHFREWGTLSNKDAEDVLIDMLLLARCTTLVHTSSSVSTVASLFNPELKLVRVG